MTNILTKLFSRKKATEQENKRPDQSTMGEHVCNPYNIDNVQETGVIRKRHIFQCANCAEQRTIVGDENLRPSDEGCQRGKHLWLLEIKYADVELKCITCNKLYYREERIRDASLRR
jgi:hypothetical protein